MKFNRKLKYLLLALLALNACCGILYYFGNRQEQKSEEQLAQVLLPAQAGLEAFERQVERHVAYLQSRVLQAATGPLPTLINQTELDGREASSLIDPDKSPEISENQHYVQITEQIELIGRIRYEIYRHLGENAIDKANESMNTRLNASLQVIHQAVDKLRVLRKEQIESARKSISAGQLIQSIALIAAVVFSLLLAAVMMQTLSATLVMPLTDLLLRLPSRKPLPVTDNELGQIAAHVNQLYQQEEQTRELLGRLSQGQLDVGDVEAYALDDGLRRDLNRIRDRLDNYANELHEKEALLGTGRKRVDELQTELDKSRQNQKQRIEQLTAAFLTFETNVNGQIIAANERLLKRLGQNFNKLKDLTPDQAAASPEDGKHYAAVWQQLRDNGQATGEFNLKAASGQATVLEWVAVCNKSPEGQVERYYWLGLDQTSRKQEFATMKAELVQAGEKLEACQKELADALNDLATLRAQKELLQRSFDKSKQLESRLLQQQGVLQQLTRNDHLKAGQVKEALRAITESLTLAMNEDRASLWLLVDGRESLRCLDAYDRRSLRHLSGDRLTGKQAAPLIEALQAETLLVLPDAQAKSGFQELAHGYLKEQRVGAMMVAPIMLAGKVVGGLWLEHADGKRDWEADEQNFLIAAADIVSLALEQGNRRAMEEELRVTLEESQALDEELRQNAEEIEATNEEMRRTQIELRGQISALNNAAIVSETNLDGSITYANKEFLTVYKYAKQQVMGKKLNILKSGEHDEEFFKNMWNTLLERKVWQGEVRNRASDGSAVWVSLSITPVMGLDGKPIKFISVGFDITRQKQQAQRIKEALQVALEQEELLRQNASALMSTNEEMRRTQLELDGQINALNNSSLVFETDMSGNIINANEQFLLVSQYEREELVGQHFTVLKSGRQPEALFSELWRTVTSGQTWRGELELSAKDRKPFWVISSINPVVDTMGEPVKYINVLFDITEQKLQEFRLIRQQSVLLELNSSPAVKEGNVKEAFLLIARRGMETLGTKRASIWLFIEGGKKVRCTTVVQNDKHEHAEGTILDTEMYPIYFRSLERERFIAASDAVNDTRTKELAFTLFKPYGISSILDTIIRQGSRTVGILSFEHQGDPRHWTLDEQSFAASMADTTSLVLEQKERQLNVKLKQAYAQLEEKTEEIEKQKREMEETTKDLMHSIKYAKRIQTNILPSKELMDRCLGRDNYFIVHRQRDTIGGDFYWFDQIGDKQVIVVADGTGHGVPGAFLTLIGYLMLNQIVTEKKITTPSEILYFLHLGVRTALKQDDDEARNTSRDGMDVAVCTLDSKSYVAEYAGANLPFYYYQDWEIHEIKPTKKSIGGEQLEEERVFENHVVPLKPGDALYLYTDGFVDQFGGPEEKRFSTKRFRDLILRTQHESMSTQRAMLNMEWKEWKDDREQLDDVTVYGMKVVEYGSQS